MQFGEPSFLAGNQNTNPGPWIRLVTIKTSSPGKASSVWKVDDDFSPLLAERLQVTVNIGGLPRGFIGSVELDFGRFNATKDNPGTQSDESFVSIARLSRPVIVSPSQGTSGLQVAIEWNGHATASLPVQLSNRRTPDRNKANKPVAMPLPSITAGKPVPHGLYHLNEIALKAIGGKSIAVQRNVQASLSVPHLAQLTFNNDWPTDLSIFGLSPFRTEIEAALLRFGDRDYRRHGGAQRINVRFVSNSSLTNKHCLFVSIGGTDNAVFDRSPSDSLFAIKSGHGRDTVVYPRTFMFFNDPAGGVGPPRS